MIVLSPPDVIATLDVNNNWHRVPRNEATHGPAPYSMEWYMSYLVDNDLPLWFMRPNPAHLNGEAIVLGHVDCPSYAIAPPSYLVTRYPVQPSYPMPQEFMYALDLTADDQLSMARRFPAIVQSVMDGNRRIFVHPNGRIEVRQHNLNELGENEVLLSRDEVQWQSGDEENEDRPVSYLLGHAEDVPNTDVTHRPSDTGDGRDTVGADGRVLNITQIPNGVGQWGW